MRTLPPGIDQRSPARHPDWLGPDDLSLKIQEIREATNYEVLIQLKLGAARVYDDVRMAAKRGPDIIYLDGAEGHRAGPHIATEETGIPLMAAIPEARRALEDVGLPDEVDLMSPAGSATAATSSMPALGANAVAIGHSALMRAQPQQGDPPGVTDYVGTVGVPPGSATTATRHAARSGSPPRTPSWCKRLDVDEAAQRVYNFLHALTLRSRCWPARAARQTSTTSSSRTSQPHRRGAATAKVPLAGHRVHPGRDRGARAGARSSTPARTVTSRTRSTSCRSRPPRSRRPTGAGRMRGEPEKQQGLDAEYRRSGGSPTRRTSLLVEDVDPLAATPGEDINWLEDITLLQEEGVPAVFDRYSNSFLRIYFPIPRGARTKSPARC